MITVEGKLMTYLVLTD